MKRKNYFAPHTASFQVNSEPLLNNGSIKVNSNPSNPDDEVKDERDILSRRHDIWEDDEELDEEE